ncbi:unnamed protein product [Spodoptera exigua]|nr:unnamed protein product [Spodoptera exigua]
MNKNIQNRISITKSTAGVTYNDAVTPTESQRLQDGEPTLELAQPTYASRFWFFNYLKMCTLRLINDLYTTFITYWYPNREILPAHIVNLMQVQSRLRAERESHAVTLSSEDDAGIHFTPKDLDFPESEREPMFVIVDSSSISDPSSKELLIDNEFHGRDKIPTRYMNNKVKPVDLPSTSTDLRSELMPPLLKGTDSSVEMQIMDINLQSDNELIVNDSDCENDSIVISYLRNKDAFLDFDGTLISTKKKSSLLESVPKLETILESEQFKLSDESLDSVIPTYPTSMRTSIQLESQSTHTLSTSSLFSNEGTNKYKRAIEFLHNDNDFLIAAELGDEKLLRILLNRGANINGIDHVGRNALHLAVCSGNQHSVLMLLKAGVPVNKKDHLGMTPLSLCLMRRPSWRMASMLFDHGARLMPRSTPMDTGLFLQFVMMCIPTKEEERILRLLVEKGAAVNDPDAPGGRQPLHFAAMSNNIRLINILVDLGANLYAVNHRNQTPKDVAATFNCKEAFGLLEQFEELSSLMIDMDEETLICSTSSSNIEDFLAV